MLPHALPRPGTIASIRRTRWRITRVVRGDGVTRVDALALRPGGGPEPVTFFAPFERIGFERAPTRPKRVRLQRWLAVCDGVRASAEHVTLPLAALPARLTLFAHQLEPVLALRDGVRRVLIADAVGLGKTIQAGLAAAELIRRGDAGRVLIVAPAHLLTQWQEELRERFGLAARIADSAALADGAAFVSRDASPWSLDGLWITSIDFIKQPHIAATLPVLPWDLVVLDEVHTMAGASDRRGAADALAREARRVLLLTATPFSGLNDGRALLTLGAHNDRDDLVAFRRSREDIGRPSRRRTRTLRLRPGAAEAHVFALLERFSDAAWRAASTEHVDATHLLLSVLRKRALSTSAALTRTLERRVAWLDGVTETTADAGQLRFAFDDDDDTGIAVPIGLPRARERAWLGRLREAARRAMREGRKLARVVTLLSRSRESVLVFTEFRDSLAALVEALARRHCAAAVAHGALAPAELARALAAFTSGRVRVLVATDVASQGLNLHHRARWVVHLDLPWNPVRLEQRAGRVDRLGQTKTVHVTRVALDVEADAALAGRVHARAQAADTAPLPLDTRWRRRARAVVRVLERRRALATRWRGPLALGRPLAAAGAPGDVWTHDFGGAETLVQCGDIGTAAAIAARRRRVGRLVRRRAARTLAVERALLDVVTVGPTAAVLPGTDTAEHARALTRRDHDRPRAVQDLERRIDALAHGAPTIAMTSARRLTRR